MATIVVAGALANKPNNGGEAWVRLSWVRGLQQLGATVYLIDEVDAAAGTDSFALNVVSEFGLAGSYALVTDNGSLFGPALDDLYEIASEADLLVNISGHLRRPDLLHRFRRKAYIDLDPGFTQFWHGHGIRDLGLEDHDLHFTVGANIGAPDCGIPTGGIDWLPVRQPVVLDDWPVMPAGDTSDTGATRRLTTVASWRGGYGPVEHAGRRYGLKVHEFRKFLELPRLVRQDLEIALSIHPDDDADRRQLLNHGWQLADPLEVAADPAQFRKYVQRSGGEFSVAQGIYVETNSGWFSDRTVRYLATGRPALVQETGYTRTLPAGVGLVPFSNMKEAVDGARSIQHWYGDHCEAARDIAERFFDARIVLPALLERAGVAA
jgi:hypothetical protein